ncbi:biotin--[acetyl-CoA-carboxylase] ligase [Mesorhizobium sp.]|uniref:biotin--[acetyl-CoA-carboxylase] ligase n=1 Tax=Mesorhizobium sp. TaxID=1871066 RepID=UPI000FE87207|nr:biotin--[acetyl-CoA-carboxylase] ligase [Mesorhizobium sp.]RWH03109.1 MAG: biotin--[acetyl-CoA-carboxylase] ligase [Mesorhizobium sp.]
MAFRLAPTAASEGFRLEAHDSVGSTNALALEHARAGDPGKLWVVSKKQESGRGRRGRAWATPEGNLALADALDAVVPQGRIAVGLDGASEGRNRFELKWPNDVLATGAKLAGILLESTLLEGGRFAVAVGIGVNVVAYPEDLPYPATSLQALGANCDAEMLFLALSDAWSENFRLWDDGRGLSAIRKRWLARAAGLGGEVAVRIDGNVVRGVFETIDEDCHFVIRDDDGTVLTIAAGDVHFGAVASARL